MSNFFAKDYSHFDSKPMELIIFEVDTHIDKTLVRSEKTCADKKGRAHAIITHHLMTKYGIIFQIAENLPAEVKLMKDYICQKTSDILNDIEELLDISEFQVSLTEEFNKIGNLGEYKTFIVPPCKKRLTVNETKFKEGKKDTATAVKNIKSDLSK